MTRDEEWAAVQTAAHDFVRELDHGDIESLWRLLTMCARWRAPTIFEKPPADRQRLMLETADMLADAVWAHPDDED